jgi:hypothetical protein
MEFPMAETLTLIAALASAAAVVASLVIGAAERRDMPALQPVPVSAERSPAERRRTRRDEE